jgi:endonuclease III
MRHNGLATSKLFDRLEDFYGTQEPCWPVDPYEFLVWWHCGYPASDAACKKGWDRLKNEIGIEPRNLLEAKPHDLASAVKPGGMVPELRALRLKEIAIRVSNEFGGDLRTGLAGPVLEARRALKRFPGMAGPGSDRVLLFAGIAPVAAVPSNNPHVLIRIVYGHERENCGANYREA